ncbi:MAG: hypothetical protein LBH58_03845 [Tannerellaceae bacterium]|jgi:hypothetical protein|nr:hypothetical protein [Tannerellaceae bacterium]
METDREIGYMIDCKAVRQTDLSGCQRIYFGHETCEKRLPAFPETEELLETAEKEKLKLSLVTPFLTGKGISKAIALIRQLVAIKPDIEVITSDWGLLYYLVTTKTGTPVISRFLTGQQTDFRLNRLSPDLFPGRKEHIASCALLKSNTIQFLKETGIRRYEVNNIFQPFKLPANPPIHYSLHVPFVPLTIFKTCPANLDFNRIKRTCAPDACDKTSSIWHNAKLEHEIHRIDNALYYKNPDYRTTLNANPMIDRIVFHQM